VALVWATQGRPSSSSPRCVFSAAATGLQDRVAVDELGRARFCSDPGFELDTVESTWPAPAGRPAMPPPPSP